MGAVELARDAALEADAIIETQRIKIASEAYRWIPHAPFGRQKLFLIDLHNEREAFYGGAAGGMKSDALLQAALEYVDVPGYAGLLLRRTYADLSKPGALMDRANEWLRNTDAKWSEQKKQWRFPVTHGPQPVLQFGYLENENDKYNYQSAEFQFIGPDELTQYTESQYTYLFSRLRRPSVPCLNCRRPVSKPESVWLHVDPLIQCEKPNPDPAIIKYYSQRKDGMTVFDIPLRVRSASNPADEPTGYWVADRFVPDDFTPEDAEQPRIFWKEKIEKGEVKRRPFVPSRLVDNPFIDQKAYRNSLSELDDVTQAQLETGDWRIKRRGNIYPAWNEDYHVISWSQFEAVFGVRGIPSHWLCGISQDWGGTKSHPCVTTLFTTAAVKGPLPGCVFIPWGLTLYDAQDAQDVARRHLLPELSRLKVRDRIVSWLMSHERLTERNSYGCMGLPFAAWGLDSSGGLDVVRRYLQVRQKNKPNPFGKRDRFGEVLQGCPMLMLIVDDDQLVRAKNDAGLARHRAEFAAYSWYTPKAGDTPEKLRPQKLFNDAMDTIRCYAEKSFPPIEDISEYDRRERKIPRELRNETIEQQMAVLTPDRLSQLYIAREVFEEQNKDVLDACNAWHTDRFRQKGRI